MTLTASSSLESARRKFFHELDVQHVQKEGVKRFWAQKAKMSLTANLLVRIGKKKNFS